MCVKKYILLQTFRASRSIQSEPKGKLNLDDVGLLPVAARHIDAIIESKRERHVNILKSVLGGKFREFIPKKLNKFIGGKALHSNAIHFAVQILPAVRNKMPQLRRRDRLRHLHVNHKTVQILVVLRRSWLLVFPSKIPVGSN